MNIVLLNTSILTSYGVFKYTQLTLKEVKDLIWMPWAFNGSEALMPTVTSAIGHQSTAEVLTKLLEMQIDVNRINYIQNDTDVCIVFKLNGRPEEGKILTTEEIESIGYEFGRIEKLKIVEKYALTV